MNWQKWARRYQRFWFDLEISHEKLTLFRLVFFALVGLEAFLQITSAPRFGTGDFNVPHFPLLLGALPAPTRAFMLVAYFATAYAAFRFALDAFERPVCCAVAAGLAATYFISQLDSYQHHYFVVLLVFLCCFVNFRGACRGPAARLLLVQVSLLYGWAAIAKLDPVWLDGTALTDQVKGSLLAPLIERVGPSFVAVVTLLVEAFLAIALQIPRLWPVAIAIAVPFHIGIELSDLQIGLFSYFMISVYILLLPKLRLPALPRVPAIPRLVRLLGSLLAGTALLLLLPFEEAWIIAILVGCAGLAIGLRYDRNAGHFVVCALLCLLAQYTDVALDYYRFWGGSSRRLGKLETATHAYQRLTVIRPDYAPGWKSLSSLYEKQGRPEEARAAAEKAQALDGSQTPAE